MRISDWSSDVCSSDLATGEFYFDAVCRGEQCLLRICLIDLDADDAGHKFADVPALEIAFVEFAKADMTCQERGRCGEFHAKLSLQRVRRRTVTEYLRLGFPERSEEHTSELQSLMRISYAVFRM